MPEEYTISRADITDAGEILCLQRAAYQSEAVLYNDFTIQPLTQTLDEAIEEFQSSVVLKAVLDGEIIGSIRAHEENGDVYIGKLMVHPEHQNKGIGKRLLRAIESEFPGKRFELYTGINSVKNIAVYEKCGYSRFKTLKAAPGLTFVYMEKRPFHIRAINADDYPKLEDFLYHAIFLLPGSNPLAREIIFQPELFIYIDGFGSKPGDCGVAAEADGGIVGAAWARIIPGYGHIDDDTPELAISVQPGYRGRGIGTALLTRLFELLQGQGFKRTSLSVQKANPAARLYQRVGYKILRKNEEDWIMMKSIMSKKLVAYFSAGGVTRNVAKALAEAIGADLFEIKPETPYTKADLDWRDKNSRSSVEMADKASRPAIAAKDANIAAYDVVFIGFPIWWYVAPTIINTFLESYNFAGKTIVPFATSGSSGIGETVAGLKASVAPSTIIREGKMLNGRQTKENLAVWANSLGL